MPDDEKPKPNPVDDLKKGLGLLFRAAKGAVEKLPLAKGAKLEDVVMSGVREVGRAVENVAETIDKELFRKESPQPQKPSEPAPGPAATTASAQQPEEKPEPSHGDGDGGDVKGPRVG